MRVIAAYALCVVGGNATPSAADVTAIITAGGGEADEASVASLIADMNGKSLEELLIKGEEQLESYVGAAVGKLLSRSSKLLPRSSCRELHLTVFLSCCFLSMSRLFYSRRPCGWRCPRGCCRPRCCGGGG